MPRGKIDLQKVLGPSTVAIDGFFGLGIQPSDLRILPVHLRPVVIASQIMCKIAKVFPPLQNVADSIYISAVKPRATSSDTLHRGIRYRALENQQAVSMPTLP